MNIVLLGIQGCGKGTLVLNLEKVLNFTLVSVGQLLRDEIHSGSNEGKLIKEIIDKGSLVSDDIALKVIDKSLSKAKENIIFDGFPRTKSQAKALDKICKVDLVIYLKLSKQAAIERILDRVNCKDCGYITKKSLIKNMICPSCGGALYIRDDDNLEALNKRFNQYEKETLPLIKIYSKRGVLAEIDANQTEENVFKDVVKVLRDYNKK